MSFSKQVAKRYKESIQSTGEAKGYYLRTGDKFYFISKSVDLSALERVASQVLNDKVGYEYWVDYSSGLDVEGKIAWSNLDYTDRFF